MRTVRSLSVLIAAAAAAAAAWSLVRAEGSASGEELRLKGDPVHRVLPPDRIRAIDEPEFVTAEEADALYADDEPVLGVAIGGEARAYSLWHLDRHEIVNDTVGGRAIAATW